MKVLYTIFSLVVAGLPISLAVANGGFDITVETRNFDGDEAYLAYYLGPGQYVMDTARNEDGVFQFTGEESLEEGFYLVVFPPTNAYFHVLIHDDPQKISLKVDGSALHKPYEVEGSHDTELFYEYAEYLALERPKVEELQSQLRKAPANQKEVIERKLEIINTAVKAKQDDIARNYPNYLTTMLINAHREFEEPEFEGTEEEVNEKTYEYYREHYFDNIPLSDPRIARTPFIDERIKYYMESLTYQVPDSINKSLDYILGHFDPDGEPFKIYLVHFLNDYAKSNVVGMDAVYVHLVDKYYATGMASWTEEEQLSKIVSNASKLRPILIGKKAPELEMKDAEGKLWSLHGVDSEYTVLFFWDPECGHCKKSIPPLTEFYEEYREKGVEIYAVCTKLRDGVEDCWEAVEERGMGGWINVADPLLKTRYKQIYDVRVTPQVYVLDRDKTIIMKKISAEQLPGILDHFINETVDQ